MASTRHCLPKRRRRKHRFHASLIESLLLTVERPHSGDIFITGELAAMMRSKTSPPWQAVVARLEGGRTMPSTRTLERFARATHTRLPISFEPEKPGRSARR